MRNWEKQTFAVFLDEEAVLEEELERMYVGALHDIEDRIRALQADELTQSRIYRKEHQEALRGQVLAILALLQSKEYTAIDDFLKESYTNGYLSVMYSLHKQGIPLLIPIDPKKVVKAMVTESRISEGLYKRLGVDVDKLTKTISQEISRGIVSGMTFSDIARNIAARARIARNRAKTIARTDAHRIQEAAAQDAREAARENGASVVKQWDATLDGRTRKTHRRLDGQIRDVDEPFEVDGKTAMYPGGFGRPEEDINCRCIALTRAEWALGEQELQTMKERAEFFKLDKTKNFEEFKKKYMDAVKE